MSAQVNTKRRRVYEEWQGNEEFFCRGHLVAGPNWRASLGSAFLLLAPSAIFCVFVAPWVAAKVHIIILVISCILPALCTLWLFMTACRDPGIIPRQEADEEYQSGRKPRTQEVMVNGHRVVIRYNDTCHFYQPPRAHHCSVNDNCIERFDHHCPWVGTTIGKRNYRTFLLFVYTSTILCLYVIGVCLAQLFLKHNELADDNKAAGGDGSGLWARTFVKVIPAVVLMVYCFIFLWFVGGLACFHAYLVATNQTTYENFRYNHDNRTNPFDLGLMSNCAEVWCMKVPPSQVKFRAYLDEVNHVRSPDQVDIEIQGQNGGHNGDHAPAPPPPQPQQMSQQPKNNGNTPGAASWQGNMAGHAAAVPTVTALAPAASNTAPSTTTSSPHTTLPMPPFDSQQQAGSEAGTTVSVAVSMETANSTQLSGTSPDKPKKEQPSWYTLQSTTKPTATAN